VRFLGISIEWETIALAEDVLGRGSEGEGIARDLMITVVRLQNASKTRSSNLIYILTTGVWPVEVPCGLRGPVVLREVIGAAETQVQAGLEVVGQSEALEFLEFLNVKLTNTLTIAISKGELSGSSNDLGDSEGDSTNDFITAIFRVIDDLELYWSLLITLVELTGLELERLEVRIEVISIPLRLVFLDPLGVSEVIAHEVLVGWSPDCNERVSLAYPLNVLDVATSDIEVVLKV
jgi:hypothetical protein